LEIAGSGFCAKPREEGFFFIRCMPFATRVKILQRSLYGRPFLARKASDVGTIRNQA